MSWREETTHQYFWMSQTCAGYKEPLSPQTSVIIKAASKEEEIALVYAICAALNFTDEARNKVLHVLEHEVLGTPQIFVLDGQQLSSYTGMHGFFAIGNAKSIDKALSMLNAAYCKKEQ